MNTKDQQMVGKSITRKKGLTRKKNNDAAGVY